MRRLLLAPALCAAASPVLCAAASPALGAYAALSVPDLADDGFTLTDLAVGPPLLADGPFGVTVFGVVRTLSNGDAVTFDGLTVRRVTADGTPLATLGTLPSATFPGCFAVDPTETFVLVGESSNGDVFRAELDGGGMSFLVNLPNNFDATFEAPGSALVSANKTLSFSDNHVVRLDTTTGATSDLCFVSGPSGPLALDAGGNLYYGLQSSPASVVVWTAADLASGVLLGESEALVIASGFFGLSSIAIDHANGGVYAAENDFSTGANRIVQVIVSASLSPVVVTGEVPFNNLGGLEFVSNACGALFAGWQPECGGTLRYSAADFVSVSYRSALTPERPLGALTGAGAGPGPGPVAFEVTGGPSAGFAQIFLGATAGYGEPEIAYVVSGALPLFTGLPPASIVLVGGPLALDPAGAARLATHDPGLDGLVTVQAICFDPVGFAVGTSTAAHL